MEIKELYSIFRKCGKVATDSRKICGGELFFALKGENFDGNEYAVRALDAGAAYVVVNAGASICADAGKFMDLEGNSRVIVVDDTLTILQELARWHREHVLGDDKRLTIIGITGTNGKTTTKELIKAVLLEKYDVIATEGNLNNDIGVPLSVLKLTSSTEIAVIEMVASHTDDIKHLVRVCDPDYGIVTNVGKGHLLGFGNFDGVRRAKGQLYDYINDFGKAVFINVDDPVLVDMAEERKGISLIPYGLKHDSCTVLETTEDNPFLNMRLHDGAILNTKLVGTYNAANVLAALCIGRYFEVPEDVAMKAVSGYVPSNSRSQMVRTEHNNIIVDAYNANPASMAASLANFAHIYAQRKAAFLGNMLELGVDSVSEHIAILELAMKSGIDIICLVGEEFKKALDRTGIVPAEHSGIRWYQTSQELADSLKKNPLIGYTILVKGSRGTRMENTIPAL